MSKRISRLLALFLTIGICLAPAVVNHASGPQRAELANSATRNTAVIAATEEVLKETSALRELSILKPVKSGAESRADIERMLIKNLDEQMTAGQMHGAELSMRKFGLTPPDFKYRPFIIKLLTEQVAGYYDPKSQQFHLADWLEIEGQKPVMAHELTHALQDQHFNLRRFEKWPHGDSDAEMAAHALIEGDATLAMTLYMARNPLVALAFARSLGSMGVSSEQFNQAPPALRASLVFPYLQGLEWTRELYKRGGWGTVSKAFTKLPLSTEQILHPEKYFAYEQPVKIALPDLTRLLNGSVNTRDQQTEAGSSQQSRNTRYPARQEAQTRHDGVAPNEWRRIDTDVNGEWSYYLILEQFLKSQAESRRAAAGWAGDRYDLYEQPQTGQVLIAQVSTWDTENDAQEFFDAYVKRTSLRYAGATKTDTPLESADSKLETRKRYTWQTKEGTVVVERRGLRVLIIEGVPDGADANSFIRVLSSNR